MSPLDVVAKEAKCKDLEKVVVGDTLEKFFQVGAQLPPQEKEELVKFLKRNIDVFAWDTCDAPGIDQPSFSTISTLTRPSLPKSSHPDAHQESMPMRLEVMKLKRAGAIKEVFYPEWLANTVVVKKKSEKWRVCVDFTDLNKACPKDPFFMPRIDQLVDVTMGHPRMSFLDAF